MNSMSVQNGKIRLNRIEPVDDKEVNKNLFEMYANITEPLRFVENKMNEAEELRRQGYFLREKKFRSVKFFITVWVITSIAMCIGIFYYYIWCIYKVGEVRGTGMSDEEFYQAFYELYPVGCKVLYAGISGRLWLIVTIMILIITIIRYLVKVKKKKDLLRNMENEYNQLQENIGQAIHVLEPYLQYVPPAYRNSYALQHFVEAYMNLKVNNVAEAVKEYDVYLHRRNVVQGLRQISGQMAQINYIQRQSLAAQRAALVNLNMMQGWMAVDSIFSKIL